MPDSNGLVHRPQGGASLEVESGGAINIKSGGSQVVDAGGTVTVAGTLALAAGAALSVSGASAVAVKVSDVTLSAAQMLALNATPVTVVAAPGAGFMTIVLGILCFYDYLGTEFGGVGATEDLAFKYTDGSGQQICAFETTGWLNQTSDGYRLLAPQYAATGTPGGVVPVANAAIVAQLLNGEFATGNGTVRVRVFHLTVPI